MTDKKTDLDVLVVGGGPTGLTMAIQLARQGVNFRVIDKYKEPSDKSKALGVHSRTLEILDDFGVIDEFLASGVEVNIINVFADGKRIAHLTLDELDSPFPFALCLPQSRTEELLRKLLGSFGKSVEHSLELVEMEQLSDRVIATIIDADGNRQEISCRYLVGCDGSHSKVRHLLGLDFEGEQYPETFLLADVSVEGDIAENEINVFNNGDGLLAIFPYGNNRYRIVGDIGETAPSEKEPDLAEVQKVVDERCPTKLSLGDPRWIAAFAIHRRHVNRYRVGRVFIAGDAAHIHSPAGGQGMNTGIQDACNLAWKLALALSGRVSEDFLESYNDERLAIALGVLKMTDFMMKVNTTRNPVAKHLRNKIAPLLSAQEVIQERMRNSISEHSLNYRKSAIVAEHAPSLIDSVVPPLKDLKDSHGLTGYMEFHRGPRAGDLAPDAFVESRKETSPERLYPLLAGTRHNLLVLAGREPSRESLEKAAALIKSIDSDYGDIIDWHVIVDSHEDLDSLASLLNDESRIATDWDHSVKHKYGADSACLYLIRPDGYIAFRSQPLDESTLRGYLNQHFLVLTRA